MNYMIREASIIALRDHRNKINSKDLSEAYDPNCLWYESLISREVKDKI